MNLNSNIKFASVLAAIVALSACSTLAPIQSTSAPTGKPYKVGTPYQVRGVWYYPKEQPTYDETGLASWYGPNFHGKSTANGETFNQNELTAAHRTLPMPVKVRVTNLENGKQVVLKVNDRGPFVHGRIIDVSKHAAELLGFKNKGTAKVRVEYLGLANQETFKIAKAKTEKENRQAFGSAPVAVIASTELAPPVGAKAAPEIPAPRNGPAVTFEQPEVTVVSVPMQNDIYVQTGAFQIYENALLSKSRLLQQGYDSEAVRVQPVDINGARFYRVQVGPIMTIPEADQTLAQILSRGHAGARIVVDAQG